MTKHRKFKEIQAPSYGRCQCGWIITTNTEKLAKKILNLHIKNCVKPVSIDFTQFKDIINDAHALPIPKYLLLFFHHFNLEKLLLYNM